MTRRKRTPLLARGYEKISNRDPGITLIFVATEDTYAGEQYLEALQGAGLVNSSRVKILPLPTRPDVDGNGTLPRLVERLAERKNSDDVLPGADQFWAIFDIDQQRIENLRRSAEDAREQGFGLAGSNPCFELWLLLHRAEDISQVKPAADDRGAARACEKLLHETLQEGNPQARGYDKRNIGAERFVTEERISRACARARTLSPQASGHDWPPVVGSHMYALLEVLPRPLGSRPW